MLWCGRGVGDGNQGSKEESQRGEVHFGVYSCIDGSVALVVEIDLTDSARGRPILGENDVAPLLFDTNLLYLYSVSTKAARTLDSSL